MNFQIRQADVPDSADIAVLLRGIGYFAHINAEPAEATCERINQHLSLALADDSHSIYVAHGEPGEILGYCAVHWLPYLILAGPEGYISELFVRESARGQGIGGQLLRAVEADAQQRGCSRLMLLNRRRRESYQRQFYLKQGWVERPEMANFIIALDKC